MNASSSRTPERQNPSLLTRRRSIFRRLWLSLVALLFALRTDAQEKPAAPVEARSYTRDIDFLVAELPKLAGRFFAVKNIDWLAVGEEFTAAAKDVKTDEECLKLCARLVARLKDGHAGIVDAKIKWPDESKGRRWTGPRVHLLTIGDGVFVRAAFGEAETRGMKSGLRVERIDGKAAMDWLKAKVAEMGDLRGFSTGQQALYAACHGGLADWEGTPAAFDVIGADGRTRHVEIVRNGGPNYAPFGPVFPPKNLKTLGRNSYGKTDAGSAYIHLRIVPGDLEKQLDAMLAEIGGAPGLILDMRGNGGGGCDHTAVFGRFVPKGTRWRQYPSFGPNPFAGPMVVILDAGVASAGETVGGMFKEDGRAYAIGDSATAGMSSSKKTLTVPSGMLTVRVSVFSNKARINGGRGIEGIGVPPNEIVPWDARELAAGIDTQIRRAEELLKKGFPEGAVGYRAEKR